MNTLHVTNNNTPAPSHEFWNKKIPHRQEANCGAMFAVLLAKKRKLSVKLFYSKDRANKIMVFKTCKSNERLGRGLNCLRNGGTRCQFGASAHAAESKGHQGRDPGGHKFSG